jgi:5-formyltetrahydrofolate cyclo-ligase
MKSDSQPRRSQDRDSLRRELRARRGKLDPLTRQRAEQRIFFHLSHSPLLARHGRVAFYRATGSECDVSAVQALAHTRGCHVYLPRITDYEQRSMQLVADRGRYTVNRYRIAEPIAGGVIAARATTVIFLPLVGFTAEGVRLGTGGGYYDRLLAFHHERIPGMRPLLIGVGYDCQRIDHLAPNAHDVPMDAVVTETGLLHCQWKKNS